MLRRLWLLVRPGHHGRPGAAVHRRDAASPSGCGRSPAAAVAAGAGDVSIQQVGVARRRRAPAGARPRTPTPARLRGAGGGQRLHRPRKCGAARSSPTIRCSSCFFGDARGGRPTACASLGSGVIATRRRLRADQQPRGAGGRRDRGRAAPTAARSTRQAGRRRPRRPTSRCCKIDAPRPAGRSRSARADTLQVGDVVLAIGNPFDVGQTVTMGIVSRARPQQPRHQPFENFIQTDAAINQGNSGGALVDARGHLVGINTAIFSRTGGIDRHRLRHSRRPSSPQVMDQLIKTGTRRARLLRHRAGGHHAGTGRAAASCRAARACVVQRRAAHDARPASAGMEPGDVIAVDQRQPPCATRRAMLNQIAQLPPGASGRA
ncbi:MAG: trypsin-like peptidase domain-containing protein [Comamonadaceae bacterium]|nr:trypsin-like peptidase domain-containing protein [Comamonadaceae bacterium]